ncbi:MAG: amidohydrolase [Chitinispirillales bacterium]|jgi:amidohydrolase|nr:amidohydrolase [Chitinispirillales bacterium]
MYTINAQWQFAVAPPETIFPIMNKTEISSLKKQINQIAPEAAELRRAIHRNPELSEKEFETAGLIYNTLRSWGLAPKYHLDKTAVSLRVDNGKGPSIVLRADTDALPVQEENDLPFASVKPGIMHACGHDMHIAILLGAAKILTGIKDKWKGTVHFLFQPSEEKEPGGAVRLIKAGVFPTKADAVFGLHVSSEHKCGHIGIKEGSDYAGVLNFDVTVMGRGGHGATPEKAVDPITCAASMITQLQTLISREKPSSEPAVLTVGYLRAGTGRNIIPDTAEFKGTARTYSNALQNQLMKRIKESTAAIAAAFGASVKVSFDKSYPPGYNNPELAKRFKKAAESFFGQSRVIERKAPTMYAEDFAYYQQLIPGLYIYLGSIPSGKKTMEELHSSRFLPDEKAMETGIAAHVLFILMQNAEIIMQK